VGGGCVISIAAAQPTPPMDDLARHMFEPIEIFVNEEAVLDDFNDLLGKNPLDPLDAFGDTSADCKEGPPEDSESTDGSIAQDYLSSIDDMVESGEVSSSSSRCITPDPVLTCYVEPMNTTCLLSVSGSFEEGCNEASNGPSRERSSRGLQKSRRSRTLGGIAASTPTPGKLPRPCTCCRLAKVRCDRNDPCTRCIRLSIECTVPKSVPRGRPSRARLQERARLQGQAAKFGLQTGRVAHSSTSP